MNNTDFKTLIESANDKGAEIEAQKLNLACLVPKKESITALSSLLSDHETTRQCGCEIKALVKQGAALPSELLLKALIALQFECGGRCAPQNPCNAREALNSYENGE